MSFSFSWPFRKLSPHHFWRLPAVIQPIRSANARPFRYLRVRLRLPCLRRWCGIRVLCPSAVRLIVTILPNIPETNNLYHFLQSLWDFCQFTLRQGKLHLRHIMLHQWHITLNMLQLTPHLWQITLHLWQITHHLRHIKPYLLRITLYLR